MLIGEGSYTPPKLGGKFKGGKLGPSPTYSFSAQVAEVEVDLKTGKVRDKPNGDRGTGGRIDRSIIVESDGEQGSFGAKEVGGGAIQPVIPAIPNAIYDDNQ